MENGGGSPQNPTVSREENLAEEEVLSTETGLQIWGDVKFREDAVVGAHVKGDVKGAGRVIVKEGAVVTGALEGSDLRVQGEVQGGVAGRGQVWIGSQAKVKLRCQGQSLRIEPGAEFRGEIQVG
ncbi:polymer-forming cytoskeletal protein [bacterium]|nr:polymer-forming cytoskeletal protein [bacterium]